MNSTSTVLWEPGRATAPATRQLQGIDRAQVVVEGVPDPELIERPRRRRFTAEYKLRILREADGCGKPGEIGVLLRREGLYSSLLTEWRRARDSGALRALERPRGRPKADPRDAQMAALRRRAERAEAELEKARRVIEVQGNVSALLGECSSPGARRGAPNDDRADRRRPHHDHRNHDQLTVHADRGTSMTSKPVAFLLADFGVGSQCTSGFSR